MTEDNNIFQITGETVTKDGMEKTTVNKSCLKKYLSHLKNSAEFGFDILITITGFDKSDNIELVYMLYSSTLNKIKTVSIILEGNNPVCESISDIYKSAGIDECEIYDMFGVYFEGHKNIKRIFMPESMIGNPLRKDYNPRDERLVWNENR